MNQFGSGERTNPALPAPASSQLATSVLFSFHHSITTTIVHANLSARAHCFNRPSLYTPVDHGSEDTRTAWVRSGQLEGSQGGERFPALGTYLGWLPGGAAAPLVPGTSKAHYRTGPS